MDLTALRQQANWTRYRPGQQAGHYESFFLRANHPTRPLAFWIRYTLFSPDRRPDTAIGELWAVAFDGETGHHHAAKSEVPIDACAFAPDRFAVRIGEAHLDAGHLTGAAGDAATHIAWDLRFHGDARPLFLLAPGLYAARLPRAKSLVGLPLAVFDGTLRIGEQSIDVRGWVGSQNHNWGSQHTDAYAWGQVAGFDGCPDSFLEIGTARLKFGPLWTPNMTVLVLRHRGREIALNTLRQSLRARGAFRYFEWTFRSEDADQTVEGHIAAPKNSFVGLRYYNPPGGEKWCLNSKLAACEIRVTDKRAAARAPEVLRTAHRAAFEILTDDTAHGVAIRI